MARSVRAIAFNVTYTSGMGDFRHARTVLALVIAGLPLHASGQEAMEAEKKFSITFETTQHKQYCKARLLVEYTQRNTMADYNGEITNEDCGASSGTYIIAVRYRDEAGEVHSVETEHEWERDDHQTVVFAGQYEIGENVDLVRVRGRKIQCVCAEISPPAEEQSEQGEIE